MRFLLCSVLAACGAPPPTTAPLVIEFENQGPAGEYSVAVQPVIYRAGKLELSATPGDYWSAISTPTSSTLARGESRASERVTAPIDASLTFAVDPGTDVPDGGCTTTAVVSAQGLRLRAVFSSDWDGGQRGSFRIWHESDGGTRRPTESCQFTVTAPTAQ